MQDTASLPHPASRDVELDAVVIGAGFAGIYMLHRLRQIGLSSLAFEAGEGVGGTWFWNCYPGARCDVDSLEYSFSFSEEIQQDWSWSERFAAQPEILAYLNHVVDRLALRDGIRLSTRVVAAHWDEGRARWLVTTDRGDRVHARYLISAAGCLSMARTPELPGLEHFGGEVVHTGRWPKRGVALAGKRVAVVGTGSSGIQVVPMVAQEAVHLTVFQRTANFSIPARNVPTDREREREWKAVYAEKRRQARLTTAGILYDYNDTKALSVSEDERRAAYERRWQKGGVNFMRTFCDLVLDRAANDTAADFVRAKIAETVRDEATARKLMPRDHPIGTKRICIDTDYFATYNRENVTLIDLRETPIREVTASGMATTQAEHPVDVIIFATGFDAVTGPLMAIDVKGRDGVTIRERWAEGPKSYLGLMTAGFPNLFTITGPGSPSILTNVVVSIEQHVEWIAEAIAEMEASGIRLMEAEPEAEARWMDHVAEVAGRTLMVEANSWYMGANIPGKPRVFLPFCGGFAAYREICDEVVAKGYEGFALTEPERPARSAAG